MFLGVHVAMCMTDTVCKFLRYVCFNLYDRWLRFLDMCVVLYYGTYNLAVYKKEHAFDTGKTGFLDADKIARSAYTQGELCV